MKTKKYPSDHPSYLKEKFKWIHLIKKLRFIKDLGGICKHCGKDLLNAPYDADFHHLDPDKKDHLPSHIIKSSSYLKAKIEIDKCILLCSACHRFEHFGWKVWKNYKDELMRRADEIHENKPTQKRKEDFVKHNENIKTLYLSGLSLNQISDQEKLPLSSVSYTVNKLGIKRELDLGEKITIDQAIEGRREGLSSEEIAIKYNCDFTTVDDKIRKWKKLNPGIFLRKPKRKTKIT